MKHLMRVLKACADPNRMRILKMLQRREMCVCELTEALGIAQPSVSRHMRILEDAELVEPRKQGPWVNYRLNPSPGTQYAKDLLSQLRTWLEDDRDLQGLLQRAAGLDRNVICGKLQPRHKIPRLKDATR